MTAFHVDCTGYSPEIAQELDDLDYLSPQGISKQFILISMNQVNLPIARGHFTSTYDFFREFVRDNRSSLVTLTSLDAVFGELENHIYRVESIEDVLNADTVRFVVDTPKRLINKANALTDLIEGFIDSEDESWADDDVYQRAIELANQVGNVNHNSLKPEKVIYNQDCYYTSHFGGIYIFKNRGDDNVTLIFMTPENAKLLLPRNVRAIDGTNVREVHKFLIEQGYIESIPAKDMNVERLRLKKYQIILDTMAYQHHIDFDISNVDDFTIKQFVQENYNSLPMMFHQLKDLVVSAERDEDRIYHDDGVLFYTSKISEARNFRPYYSLINHLVSNYTPQSYLRMFTFNRELFVASYTSWPDSKKDYVDKYINEHIKIVHSLKDKATPWQ